VKELRTWLEALARVGVTGQGGIYRGSYLPAEQEAQELVTEWMRLAGLSVRRDAIGNLWGRLEGDLPGAPAIATGSHLDSVRNGGHYDGPCGVVGGVLAVRDVVARHGRPRLSLEVVAFTGEEGSRFPLGHMGSRAVVGTLDPRFLHEVKDDNGVTVADAMRAVGLDPGRVGEARRRDLAAFVELHIEQGPILERAGIPIGIVQSIVGVQRVLVTVHGRADHAGTTPMHERKDALLGSARMIGRFPDIAVRHGGVMTVGRIVALPGSANVVPGTVEFNIDVRHLDDGIKRHMVEAAREICQMVASDAELGLEWLLHAEIRATPLSSTMQRLLRECCEELGFEYLEMPSGAGHDAQDLAAQCPTGMIFVPCRDGRSHSPDEFAAPADMEKGVAVLASQLYKLAYEDALSR
jgi:allantoate deiminase